MKTKKTPAKPRTAPAKARITKARPAEVAQEVLEQRRRELLREVKQLEKRAEEAKHEYSVHRYTVEHTKRAVEVAAKAVQAAPDLVGQVAAAAAELIRRFCPHAHAANLTVFQWREDGNFVPNFELPIPIPQPTATAEDVKRVVRAYANAEHPGWRVGSASVRLGEMGGDDERGEVLLVEPEKK